MKVPDFAPLIQAVEKTRGAGRILLAAHEKPDGDAIGCVMSLWHLLRDNGFEADVCLPDQIPDAYLTLIPQEALAPVMDAGTLNSSYALVFSADASTPDRVALGNLKPAEVAVPFIALDHHPDHIEFARIVYLDGSLGAASGIVYQMAKDAGWKISALAATLMLMGITSDTGGFRFDNTDPRIHRIAADLMELGADNRAVVNRLFFSKPMNMAAFEAELFCTALRTAYDGRFVWMSITRELLDKYNVNVRNMELLVDSIRALEGVVVAALIKPASSPGIFKASLRSKDPAVSVGNIARRLNGGGHEMAAGCTIFAHNYEHAEDILLKHVGMELQ